MFNSASATRGEAQVTTAAESGQRILSIPDRSSPQSRERLHLGLSLRAKPQSDVDHSRPSVTQTRSTAGTRSRYSPPRRVIIDLDRRGQCDPWTDRPDRRARERGVPIQLSGGV